MNVPAVNSPTYWEQVYMREISEGRFRQHDNVWKAILPHLPETGVLLDVGCGTGEFLRWLLISTSLDLIGTDHSGFVTDFARRQSGDDGRILFTTCPADRLSLAAEQVDVVYSGHLLEHLSDPVAALREQYRVLKPGGMLIVHFPHLDQPYIEHLHILDWPLIEEWVRAAGFSTDWTKLPVIPGRPTNDGVLITRR